MQPEHQFIAALATLALLAGSATVAFGQSPPPAAADPTGFTASVAFGSCTGERIEVVAGVTQTRGGLCTLELLDVSDPRLGGTWTVAVDHDAYPNGVRLWMGAYRVENGDGAWQQAPNLAFDFLDGTTSTKTITLAGEGGYAGSTAVAEVDLEGATWDLRGFILDRDVPAPGVATD